MKAFIFDPLWDELITSKLIEKLKKANIETVVIKKVAPLYECKQLFEGHDERLLCLNPDYVGWKLAAEDYKNIPNLKAILGAATSFSWIDNSYADKNTIPICNIRGFSTQAVAEWAVMMMLNVARRVPMIIKDGFPLDFDKDFMKYRGVELYGKRAGIIGLGNIGNEIAKRCSGLGMKVVYWSRSPKTNDYEHVELAELMKSSDVVFPALALNDETKDLLTDELIGSMKKSAILVSVIHHLFSQELVLSMVEKGKLFGFGFESESETFNQYKGNVWAAPAYAWATDGSMNNSMVSWVENMVNAAKGK
ncbi:MAG TPA: NAD(P)-dependent oxidoreductase, partial [Candidatus Saccharimonadales bacterium]|nr:NAD(P)-dependent oxidoreductase [Candidatus Saccharimonadales bacterium]